MWILFSLPESYAHRRIDYSKTMNSNGTSFWYSILYALLRQMIRLICKAVPVPMPVNIVSGSSSVWLILFSNLSFSALYMFIVECSRWADVNGMHRKRQKLDWHATFSNYMSCSFYSWLINTPSLLVRVHAPFKWDQLGKIVTYEYVLIICFGR